MTDRIDRDDCYICSGAHRDLLERHHLVPRRHGGSDDAENLVDLCPTCHQALEKLYDKRFYESLGVDTTEDNTCDDANDEELDPSIIEADDEGQSPSDSHESNNIAEIIQALQERLKVDDIPRSILVEEVKKSDIPLGEFERELISLKDKGEIYEPKEGVYRST